MTGAPTFIARSMTLQIFSAYASDSDPPKTVKSCEKTKTSRPSIEPVPGHDAVAEEVLPVEAELGRPMGDERVELDERARVEQQVEPFAGRELAPGVLALDPDRSPAEEGLLAHLPESLDACLIRRHGPLPDGSARPRLCARTARPRRGPAPIIVVLTGPTKGPFGPVATRPRGIRTGRALLSTEFGEQLRRRCG